MPSTGEGEEARGIHFHAGGDRGAAPIDGRVDFPLLQDSLTPGGLNALALETIEADGGFQHIKKALEAVHRRIQS